MSIHHFRKPTPNSGERREVTLEQSIPAFRANDAVLEQVWRTMCTKCAEVGEPTGWLRIYETVRTSRSGPREECEYKYESIDDLRRSPRGPSLLREYTLSVSSPWGDNYRNVRLSHYRHGRASVTATGPDAKWCHKVIAAVLVHLRAHAAWYSFVHCRAVTIGLFASLSAIVVAMAIAAALELPLGIGAHAMYWTAIALISVLLFGRDRLFPAADIHVERRAAEVVPHGQPPTSATASKANGLRP